MRQSDPEGRIGSHMAPNSAAHLASASAKAPHVIQEGRQALLHAYEVSQTPRSGAPRRASRCAYFSVARFWRRCSGCCLSRLKAVRWTVLQGESQASVTEPLTNCPGRPCRYREMDPSWTHPLRHPQPCWTLTVSLLLGPSQLILGLETTRVKGQHKLGPFPYRAFRLC